MRVGRPELLTVLRALSSPRQLRLVIALAAALPACAGSGLAPGGTQRADFVVAAADWGSRPGRIPSDRRQTPTWITLHHAGVDWRPENDPYVVLPRMQRWGKREQGWPDVAYHFLIAPDGRVFEGRQIDFQGETRTGYDVGGHVLIQLWGNFDAQRVSLEQLRSVVRLMAWLCRTFGLSPDSIAAHKDWSSSTSCPGRDLYRYVAYGDVQRWTEEALDGAVPAVELRPPLAGGATDRVPGS